MRSIRCPHVSVANSFLSIELMTSSTRVKTAQSCDLGRPLERLSDTIINFQPLHLMSSQVVSLALLILSSQRAILLSINSDEELQGRLERDVDVASDHRVLLAVGVRATMYAKQRYIAKVDIKRSYSIDSLLVCQFTFCKR
jgi:hypothetical protein